MTMQTPLAIAEPTAEWVDITPELAALWLESNADNRSIRNAAVIGYMNDIMSGRWMVTGETIKFDFTGRLIDGQHRLSAIVRSGLTIRSLVVRGIDPLAQRVIDVNIRRTAGDQLRLLGLVEGSNVMDIASAARLALAIDAGYLTRYGNVRGVISHADIFEWVETHPEIGDHAKNARRLYNRLGAAPSPLAYAMWRLAQIDAEDAAEFFQSTAEFATSGEGDPRAALIRVFANTENRLSRLPGAVIGVTFTAWNAWRDQLKIKSIPLIDPKGGSLTIPQPI